MTNSAASKPGDNGKYLRRFAYNPDENETIVTNGLGHSRTYYYKYTGLVEYALDELGHSYQQLHDENGYLISEIDKNKNIINYENDELGRSTEHDKANNTLWRTYYRGCRTIHKDPLGNAIFAVRDRGGRLLQHQDQDGNRIEYQPKEIQSHFDAWNRLVATSDPLGNYHLYAYDNNGRLVSALDPRGYSTHLRYDPQGNLAAVTDPEGFEQRFVYQGNRELVEQIDAKNNAVRFAYDCEGRMTQITNPSGDTHTFAYDPRGQLSEDTSFDQQKSKYTFDPAGNLINVQRADANYHIEYDAVYQPVRITATDGGIKHNIEYTYDDAGRLIRAENEHGHVALSYDSLGRVIREEQNDYIIANAYDAAGNLFMTRDGFGHLMEFAYTADNRLESFTIEDKKYIRIVRDAAGRPTEYHFPGAIASHCAFDPNGNLAKQATHKQCENNLRLINKRIYSRNKRGQLIHLEDDRRGNRTFVYDRAGQIVDDIHDSSLSSTFGYEPCGNPADARMASGNRLDSFQNTRFRHDARGNVVKQIYGDDVKKRTFNALNQMVAYEAPDGTRTEYAYDALGRRILKKSGAQETRYYWDQFRLCGEQTGTHRTQYVYYPNSFTPLESTEFLHCTRVFFNFHTKFRRLDAEVDPLLHQILETFVSRYFLADLSHTI
jgi:YD repeat-containing protein